MQQGSPKSNKIIYFLGKPLEKRKSIQFIFFDFLTLIS